MTRTIREPITANLREALVKAGKAAQIDPATGERIVQSITDYLPERWCKRDDPGAGGLVDSLGRPIVNATPGSPGWAQADVDALRAAIARWIAVRTLNVAE